RCRSVGFGGVALLGLVWLIAVYVKPDRFQRESVASLPHSDLSPPCLRGSCGLQACAVIDVLDLGLLLRPFNETQKCIERLERPTFGERPFVACLVRRKRPNQIDVTHVDAVTFHRPWQYTRKERSNVCRSIHLFCCRSVAICASWSTGPSVWVSCNRQRHNCATLSPTRAASKFSLGVAGSR